MRGDFKLDKKSLLDRPKPLTESLGGTKHDEGKPPMSLIPRPAMESEAMALRYGRDKYGAYNFKKGFDYSRLIDAALRHILAFNEGEELDSESGVSHLGHARACLAFLIDQQARGTGKDDRFKG